MQTMPIEAVALLKSKRQVGGDRPTYEVSLGGLSGSVGTAQTLQGHQGNAYDLSNWIETADGRYMACWFDPTNKRLRTGYSSSLDFRVVPLAVENYIEDASITVSEAWIDQTCLFRRTDGKVLLIVSDNRTLTAHTDIYISATGNGDDWAYLSQVHSVTATSDPGTYVFIGCPFYTPTGRLCFTFCGGTNYSGSMFSAGYIAYSDDEGLTWSTYAFPSKSVLGFVWYGFGGIGQGCCLPDGTLFVARFQTAGHCELFYSDTNGTSWTFAGNFDSGISDANKTQAFYQSYFYDPIRNYAVMLLLGVSSGFFVLPAPSKDRFLNKAAWRHLSGTNAAPGRGGRIYYVGGRLVFQAHTAAYPYLGRTNIFHGADLPIKSITVQRNQGMAAAAIITLDNKAGIFSPDNAGSAYKGMLMPNKEVSIRLGYGAYVPQVFSGYIDGVEMKSFPAEIVVTCRDAMKRAIDQLITTIDGTGHVLAYENKTLEYMFGDLCIRAGIPVGVVEATGVTIKSKTFSWESYIDAFAWMADLCGFEYGADELGVAYFRKKQLPQSPEPAYRFEEGEDIVSIGYLIDDAELYYSVIVFGKDSAGNAISVSAPWVAPDLYGLSPQKIMKIDVPECDTIEKCTQVLQHAIRMITSRARQVDFGAIGQPYLQVGDFIKVVESTTTISEIYRVTELSHEYDDGGYITNISCHWYSYG